MLLNRFPCHASQNNDTLNPNFCLFRQWTNQVWTMLLYNWTQVIVFPTLVNWHTAFEIRHDATCKWESLLVPSANKKGFDRLTYSRSLVTLPLWNHAYAIYSHFLSIEVFRCYYNYDRYSHIQVLSWRGSYTDKHGNKQHTYIHTSLWLNSYSQIVLALWRLAHAININFLALKIENFQPKKLMFFLFLLKT